MGIDLYAGPLQRYYTRRWETAGAAAARELDMEYSLVFPDGVDPLNLDDAAAESRVLAFAERLQPKLHLDASPCWNESFELSYETLQYTPEGFGALVLWAACMHRPELERPAKLPDDPWAEPAVMEASDRGYYMGPMAILEAQMAVPGDEPRIAGEVDPIGNEVVVCTTAALAHAIDELSPGFGLDASKARQIVGKGTPPKGPVMVERPRKWYQLGKPRWEFRDPPAEDDEVKTFAEYALSCLILMHAFASAHRVPIVRDE